MEARSRPRGLAVEAFARTCQSSFSGEQEAARLVAGAPEGPALALGPPAKAKTGSGSRGRAQSRASQTAMCLRSAWHSHPTQLLIQQVWAAHF